MARRPNSRWHYNGPAPLPDRAPCGFSLVKEPGSGDYHPRSLVTRPMTIDEVRLRCTGVCLRCWQAILKEVPRHD